MNKKIVVWMLVFFACLAVAQAGLTTSEYQSYIQQDTYVNRGSPTSTFHNSISLDVAQESDGGGADEKIIYVGINLTNITLSTLQSVSYNAFVLHNGSSDSEGQNFSAYYYPDLWDMNNITWNNQPCSPSAANCTKIVTMGTSGSFKTNETIEVDLWDTLQADKDNSFLLVFKWEGGHSGVNQAEYSFYSKDHSLPERQPWINATLSGDSLIFDVYDEILGDSVNHFNGVPVYIEFESPLDSFNVTTTTGAVMVNLTPVEYRITYESLGYRERDHYVELLAVENISTALFLLSDDNSTDVTFTVSDASGVELENALIKLKRYYIDSNSYVTVAMAKTDVQGKAIMNVDFNDPFYELLVSRNGTSVNTQGARIYSTEVSVNLQLNPDPFSSIDEINNVETTLTFNNQTQTFSYTFNSLSGEDVSGILEVVRTDAKGTSTACTNSGTSSSATILCVYNSSNQTGVITGKGSIVTGDGNIITNTIQISNTISETAREVLGNQAVFLTILFAGTLGSLAVPNPAIAIVMFLVGLGGMTIFGFSGIAMGLYITFWILGGVLIWKLRT